jgi:hypothetical protein
VALIALLRLGRHQDAARAHQVGYGLLGSSATYLFNVPGHLLHLTREGDLGRAASILERFLPTALQCDDLDDRFSFYAAAAPLLQRVAAEQEEIQLRLPPEFPPFEASGRYRAHALSEWFDGQADALADRFDTRNGNDNYRWHQTEFRRLSSLAS